MPLVPSLLSLDPLRTFETSSVVSCYWATQSWESTVRYLGVELDDDLALSEGLEI